MKGITLKKKVTKFFCYKSEFSMSKNMHAKVCGNILDA